MRRADILSWIHNRVENLPGTAPTFVRVLFHCLLLLSPDKRQNKNQKWQFSSAAGVRVRPPTLDPPTGTGEGPGAKDGWLAHADAGARAWAMQMQVPQDWLRLMGLEGWYPGDHCPSHHRLAEGVQCHVGSWMPRPAGCPPGGS